MEISNIALRQVFNAWYRANHVDLMDDPDEMDFYGKKAIEQRAYYLAFFESKNLLVTVQVNDKMFNKYFIEFYDKAKNKKEALPKNCATPELAWQYGLEKAFEKLGAQ